MRKHKLLITFIILGFSLGLFSFRAKALTLSGTARNMIVQIMDSKGNILDGVHSAISGISYPNEIVQVMNSTGTILDSLGSGSATVVFSGSPGQVQFNGAMDNNVTANLTDTTNAPFKGNMVGNLICVDGAGSAGVDACGTISSVTSSSVAVLSFQNTSGGSISGKMYAFGPDNSAALTTFNNAMAAGSAGITGSGKSGVNGFIPAGYYAVGSTGHLVFPNDRTTIISGAGGGIIAVPAGSVNGNVNVDAMPVTMFMTLTHSGTGAFVQATNSSGVGTYEATDRLQDMAIMGSVGFSEHGDGMCATCDGMDIINWDGMDITNVSFSNFGQRGIYIDTAVSGTQTTNNIDLIGMHHVFSYFNGENGIRVGGTALNAVGSNVGKFQMQDIVIDGNSFVFGNVDNGFQVISNVKGLTIRDSGFQGNMVSGTFPSSQGEISIEGQVQGGVIESNYIEIDHTNSVGIAVRTATSPQANMNQTMAITGNNIISIASAGFAHILVGTSSSNIIGGLTVEANFMDGVPSNGICLDMVGGDLTDRGYSNFCANSGSYAELPVPFALATPSNYGCTSLTEGLFATQTTSTGACSAGTQATVAGTTHCAIYCNGTHWIQTGQ